MLMLSVSKKTEKPAAEVFSRIDGISKILRFEEEIKEFELRQGNERKGTGFVSVEIFGKKINGRMRFEIGNNRMQGVVESKDIKALRFGYAVKGSGKGCALTQEVEFDSGSFIKNLLIKIFFSRKIKKHMEEEVLKVTA